MRALLFLLLTLAAHAEPARLQVFIALADNRTQGIAPVPEKIGNGDDAETNLYWGCSEALKPVLRASPDWKLDRTEKNPLPDVLERAVFRHKSARWELVANVYRGSAIKACTTAFFSALASEAPREQTPLVAYIGHDGLMDFELPAEAIMRRGPGRQAIVLCCQSREYFSAHLGKAGAIPLLTTTQLMYPGGFILRAALDGWTAGETPGQIRQRAAAAYARNQKISVKAAAGVFANEAQKPGGAGRF
ncbi:MAG: hypothetical protein K8R23_13240 [Chthoniobacter sp.]|nr:hypothetical protein [Chthoniobacter sp.]